MIQKAYCSYYGYGWMLVILGGIGLIKNPTNIEWLIVMFIGTISLVINAYIGADTKLRGC